MSRDVEDTPKCSHRTLATAGTSALQRSGSRFVSVAQDIGSRSAVETALKDIADDHPEATHLCYAYRLRSDGRRAVYEVYEDDGEPSGTAGYPILQLLKGEDLCDSLCAVVRYFGGTELGTGGLSRAYHDAARQAIDCANTKRIYETETLALTLAYGEYSKLEYFMDQCSAVEQIETSFTETVCVELEVRRHRLDGVERHLRERLGREL